jgi:serine/threonine protein kinase
MELLNAAKKTSVSGWINDQLETTRLEKRSSNSYEYIQVIGKGGFGKVYKVREKKSGQYFAMKEMSKAV